jgi:hypothetical protein
MPIKANHYINILYYFLYLTLSISTSFDAFPTGVQDSRHLDTFLMKMKLLKRVDNRHNMNCRQSDFP